MNLKVALKGTIQGQELVNVFYFDWNTIDEEETPNSYIEAYFESFYEDSGLLSALSNDVHYTNYLIYRRVDNEWVDYGNGDVSYDGAVTTDCLPPACAAVLLGKVKGWRGFGRKFLSGIGEANQSKGTLANDFLVILTIAAAYYIQAVGSGGTSLVPGIFSKDSVFRPFITGIVDTLVGSQRRRKQGVGA